MRMSQVGTATLMAVVVVIGMRSTEAHDPLSPEALQQLLAAEDYADRLARLDYLQQSQMRDGLQQRAAYRVRRKAMEAAGLSESAIGRAVMGGDRAFPYQAQPELRAFGTVKTATVLVDFKDFRAATLLPSIGSEEVAANLYGPGTAAAQARYVPFESLSAYYRRASEGKVDVRGDVFGWHAFTDPRADYAPTKAPPGPNQKGRQMDLDNRALFRMAKEALDKLDATTDFAPYDNDQDGDIDLLTILYAGPPGAWNSFWWAYRWQFYLAEASTTRFDGKRLKQFVFSFVETRDQGADYDPRTMLHEMGHAFGLADYYDYTPTPPAKPNQPPPVPDGPDGGVGGLDMMDGNQANQCAFSRWLVDWIDPVGIGGTPPAEYTLVASGGTGPGPKAIAVFPNLVDAAAPVGEFFLAEYRAPVGNDSGEFGVPEAGLVVWHVNAELDVNRAKFRYDNSKTPRLLLRMVRASTPQDHANFGVDGRAGSGDLFRAGGQFGPQTMPSSKGYGPVDTGVVIEVLSHDAETMRIRIGLDLPPGANPAGPAPGVAERALGELLDPPGRQEFDLDLLDQLDRELSSAGPQRLARLWGQAQQATGDRDDEEQRAVVRRLLLAHWAAKDGRGAVEGLLSGESAGAEWFPAGFPLAMEVWARTEPAEAAGWYASEALDKGRLPAGVVAGAGFTRAVFEGLALQQVQPGVALLERLISPVDVAGAVAGLREAYRLQGRDPLELHTVLKALRKHAQSADAMLYAHEAYEAALVRVKDPAERARLREALLLELPR